MNYIHLENETTNCVEVFSCTFKCFLERRIVSFSSAHALYLLAERLYLTFARDKVLLVNENLINREDAKKIGNFALTVIDSEYIDLQNKRALSFFIHQLVVKFICYMVYNVGI